MWTRKLIKSNTSKVHLLFILFILINVNHYLIKILKLLRLLFHIICGHLGDLVDHNVNCIIYTDCFYMDSLNFSVAILNSHCCRNNVAQILLNLINFQNPKE